MEVFDVAPIQRVRVEIYTSACRIDGLIASRFTRVSDILNLLGSSHAVLEDATLVELASPNLARSADRLHVALDEILVLVAIGQAAARPEMRIPKRPVRAEVVLPPLRLAGMVYVGMGSRPVDGLLNAADRFLPMTEATISSMQYPDLDRQVPALAFRRDHAHVLAVANEEGSADELLAEVLDARTAERWLQSQRESVP